MSDFSKVDAWIETDFGDDPDNEWGLTPPKPPFEHSIPYAHVPKGALGHPIKGPELERREIHRYNLIRIKIYYTCGYIEELPSIGGKLVCGCKCTGCVNEHKYKMPEGYKEGIWVNGEWFPAPWL